MDDSKRKKKVKRSPASNKRRKTKAKDSDTAYHFIAFVPVDGGVWQLDGLQKAPTRLGTHQLPKGPIAGVCRKQLTVGFQVTSRQARTGPRSCGRS